MSRSTLGSGIVKSFTSERVTGMVADWTISETLEEGGQVKMKRKKLIVRTTLPTNTTLLTVSLGNIISISSC